MTRMLIGLSTLSFFCLTTQAKPVDDGLDTEALANKTFDSSIVHLIRTAMESPKARIQVETRSDWHIDYFEKQSTRWWQVISFHFDTYSPVVNERLTGIAVTVFVYDPAKYNAVIMTPEDAAEAIKKGRELNGAPLPEPTPGPGSTDSDNGEI
jgi:hypothetical protein